MEGKARRIGCLAFLFASIASFTLIANLVVIGGDLLEARTNVRHLFINGRQVPLNSRHTELYEQFKNRK